MQPAPPDVTHEYLIVMERAILDLRTRIRYGEQVSLQEVHDLLDAIHNIPPMLRNYGEWNIPANINTDLERYDMKWAEADAHKLGTPLLQHLERAKAGDYDR